MIKFMLTSFISLFFVSLGLLFFTVHSLVAIILILFAGLLGSFGNWLNQSRLIGQRAKKGKYLTEIQAKT